MQKVVVIINGGDRVIPRPVLEKLIQAAEADTWECIDLPTESRIANVEQHDHKKNCICVRCNPELEKLIAR